jgi:hypothetical protein
MDENPYQSPLSEAEHSGSRFGNGKPWGFFAKTNPKATVQSTLRAAAIWSVIGAVGWCVAFVVRGNMPVWAIVPLSGFLAAIGALCEWQVGDIDEDMEDI